MCWGLNGWGQLGNTTLVDSTTPVVVNGITDAVQVSAGRDHSCAVLASGQIRCWGSDSEGELGDTAAGWRVSSPVVTALITDAAQVSCGQWFTCALRRTGEVMCWGSNDDGQLGVGDTMDRHTPAAVAMLPLVSTIAAGRESHACAGTVGGSVYCWGRNMYGELGYGSLTASRTPRIVSGL